MSLTFQVLVRRLTGKHSSGNSVHEMNFIRGSAFHAFSRGVFLAARIRAAQARRPAFSNLAMLSDAQTAGVEQ